MEQFSLEKYLANPSRKVVTRDGRRARIICTDKRELNYPIIALIETRPGGREVTYSYTKGGRHCTACADFDLFLPLKNTKDGFVYFGDLQETIILMEYLIQKKKPKR